MSDDRVSIKAYAGDICKVFGNKGVEVYVEKLISRVGGLTSLEELSDAVLLIHGMRADVPRSDVEGLLITHDPVGCISVIKKSHSAEIELKETAIGALEEENRVLLESIKRLEFEKSHTQELLTEAEASRDEALRLLGELRQPPPENTQIVSLSNTESDASSTTDGEDGGDRKRPRNHASAGVLRRMNASSMH